MYTLTYKPLPNQHISETHRESKKKKKTGRNTLPSMLPSLANLPSGQTPFHLDKFASRNLVSSHNRNSHWLYKNHALTKVLFHVPGEKKNGYIRYS
jgi:hypothetical protein